MTPSERLDEILAKFFNDLQNDYARASYRKVNINASYLEARNKIINLFIERIPMDIKHDLVNDEADCSCDYIDGHNDCRYEMIKKLEEMRK